VSVTCSQTVPSPLLSSLFFTGQRQTGTFGPYFTAITLEY
jgi:hypothetical protein